MKIKINNRGGGGGGGLEKRCPGGKKIQKLTIRDDYSGLESTCAEFRSDWYFFNITMLGWF